MSIEKRVINMQIIFDGKDLTSYSMQDDPSDTSETIIGRTKNKLKKLGEFMGVDSIELKISLKNEVYIIKKGQEVLEFTACGNSIDGGWLNID